MTHINTKIKTNQDEPPSAILLDSGVAPAPLESSTEVANLGSAQELSGKDIEFPKVDNCPSQLEFGHSGGTEAKSSGTVRPPSGESCGGLYRPSPLVRKPSLLNRLRPHQGGWSPKNGLALRNETLTSSRMTQISRIGPSPVKKRWKSWRRSRSSSSQGWSHCP
jgi:hypothetical protein